MFGDSSERTGALCGVVKLGSSYPVFSFFLLFWSSFPSLKTGRKKRFSHFNFSISIHFASSSDIDSPGEEEFL